MCFLMVQPAVTLDSSSRHARAGSLQRIIWVLRDFLGLLTAVLQTTWYVGRLSLLDKVKALMFDLVFLAILI